MLLNDCLDGPRLSQPIVAATRELDEALRAIQRMAFWSRGRIGDFDQLVVRLADATDAMSYLAEAQADDGPGHFLDEAARHLHRAQMSLAEARERSSEVQLS